MARELDDADSRIESSTFLVELARLHSSGHEHRLPGVLLKYGFQADIKYTYVNIGLTASHPVLRLSDTVACFDRHGKIESLLLLKHTQKDLKDFWANYRQIDGQHSVFTTHASHLDRVVPIYLHGDEGVTLKKKGILILQAQCAIGFGSSRTGPGLNFSGSTYVTRLLFSVLSCRLYSKKKAVLYKLLEAWSEDLTRLFNTGIEVVAFGKSQRLFFATLGMKGDWPALCKLGRLVRHHLRDTADGQGPGICHLCRAGQPGFDWFDFGRQASWLVTQDDNNPTPWNQPSPLASVPQGHNPANFYKVDLFHTCQKGIVGDFACSSLVLCRKIQAFPA